MAADERGTYTREEIDDGLDVSEIDQSGPLAHHTQQVGTVVFGGCRRIANGYQCSRTTLFVGNNPWHGCSVFQISQEEMSPSMHLHFVRTLRTNSSERFLLQSAEQEDVAVLDLHYLPTGGVEGTLIVLDAQQVPEDQTATLIEFIDESLLPMVNLDEKNLTFVVVRGEMVGTFSSEK
jgi:hypothetical protein